MEFVLYKQNGQYMLIEKSAKDSHIMDARKRHVLSANDLGEALMCLQWIVRKGDIIYLDTDTLDE